MSKKGVDISYWEKDITINQIKNAGYEFVILRGGYTGYGAGRTKVTDASYEKFYHQCKKAGMPVGVYWYSCADSKAQGIAEAEYFYESCLKGKQFEFPVYIDVEEPRWQANKKKAVTDAILAFCGYLEKKGCYCGVYASLYWFNTMIDTKRLDGLTKWVACWTKNKPAFDYNAFGMWQNSDSKKIGGYNVDANVAYQDFESVIKTGGYNGYKKKSGKAKPKKETSNDKIITKLAKEVIDGEWGSGAVRKKRLTSAGYDYEAVQNKVNELLARKSVDQIAQEVIDGKWGNGAERKQRLTKAGYDYNIVQKRVNALMK